MICLYLQIGEKIPRRYILIQLYTLKKTMGPKESMSNNHKCKKNSISFFSLIFHHAIISSCLTTQRDSGRVTPCQKVQA